MARAATRSRLRSERGASVAITTITDPLPRSRLRSFWKAYWPSACPTGAPMICRTPPKLVWTSTPTRYPPSDLGSTRDEVPMPPFHPKATVPVPAPTLPSWTGPVEALSSAVRTASAVMGRLRMSLSIPSLVSATRGLSERTDSIPGRPSIQSTRASAARQTQRVQVRRIGVSISPSSRTWVLPVSFPKPFPTCTAAGTRSR